VQVGDPFEEKRLIEACLAMLDANLVVGIQDLGGAGLTCATSETASRGGMGMDVEVTAVPLRERGMEPWEIMTSESQERMLAIVAPDDLDEVVDICRRWEVRASVVGRVTSGGRLRILDNGRELADVPASSLDDAAPLYDRPMTPAPAPPFEAPAPPADVAADLVAMLADTSWIWSQYDHQLFLNTVEGPGGDATVLRLKHPTTGEDTGRGLALSTDGNHRWCAVDPRAGTAMTVAESVLNLACVGARPLALVNCLNFGNPEHPEVMWQLSEAIDGMADACRALGLPVVGGNVSLYNESRGRDIDPTPVVGVLGMVDRLDRRPPGVGLIENGRLLVLGASEPNLAGSRWAWERGARGGPLPALDLQAHTRLCNLVRELVAGGSAAGLHDISVGGLGVALTEMAVRSGVGFRIAGVADHVELFGESPSRVVVCADPERAQEIFRRAGEVGVPAAFLGGSGGDVLAFEGLCEIPLADAVESWRDAIPKAMGAGATH